MNKVPFGSFPPRRTTRFRLAAILLLMAATIVVGKLFEDTLIERLRHDCVSLFDDRLVPAMTLFHLADQMSLKRALLEGYLDESSRTDARQVHYEMGQHDAQLESLVAQFRQTYLVSDEERLLTDLSEALAGYQHLERTVLETKDAAETARQRARLRAGYATIRQKLRDLTRVQERVGSELRAESATHASSMTSLLYLQLGIAFALGLISSGLAMSIVRVPRRVRPDSNTPLH